MKAGRRLRSAFSWFVCVASSQLQRRVYTPAASCCSDVEGRDFSSCNAFSAACRSSPFFRLASETRWVSSLVRRVEVILSTRPVCGRTFHVDSHS